MADPLPYQGHADSPKGAGRAWCLALCPAQAYCDLTYNDGWERLVVIRSCLSVVGHWFFWNC